MIREMLMTAQEIREIEGNKWILYVLVWDVIAFAGLFVSLPLANATYFVLKYPQNIVVLILSLLCYVQSTRILFYKLLEKSEN